MDNVKVIRSGLSDTPSSHWSLDWNVVGINLQHFIQDNNFMDTTFRLSPYYRVSKYMIEGERGLVSNMNNSDLSHSMNIGMEIFIK